MLEDFPRRAEQARLSELEELAQTAREAETAEIRTIGQRITSNLTRSRALEALAAGLAVELINADLEELRQICANLEDRARR